jgi:uncharacterized protein (DUF1697 family)
VTSYVCLLRGVNVGGKNKLAMHELRDLFESLGYRDVQTFIQSGNVVFSSRTAVQALALETEIRRHFELSVAVVLRTGPQLRKVVADNPFAGRDPVKLHVGFMAKKAPTAAVAGLDVGAFDPERFSVKGTEIYLYLPNGMARTKVPSYLDRRLKVPTTIRNWNTVTKLVELVGQTER